MAEYAENSDLVKLVAQGTDIDAIVELLSSKDNTAEDLRQVLLNSYRLKYEEDKIPLIQAVAEHPSCNTDIAEQVLKIAGKYGPEAINEIKNSVENDMTTEAMKQAFDLYDSQKPYRSLIENLGRETSKDEDIESFLKMAHTAVSSQDSAKIELFKKVLFSAGEQAVYNLDHRAVEWFTNHGTPENLEILNQMRGLYGLKTEVRDYYEKDSDIVDIKRIKFGNTLSAMARYVKDENSGEMVENIHYFRKHSEEYLTARPDYGREYIPEDYDLSAVPSYQKMVAEGVAMPAADLQKALAENHYSPEAVKSFNVTDLSHIYIESKEGNLDENRQYSLDLKSYKPDIGLSIRQKYWQKVAVDEQLVKFVSDDLRRKNGPESAIAQIWENCRRDGNPSKDENGKTNVHSVSLQIHHRHALKDGGNNVDDNFVIVVEMKGEREVEKNGRKFIYQFGQEKLNSHKPNHEYDNPSVELYLDNDGNMVKYKTEKRVTVITKPSDDNTKYYGGIREHSACVADGKGNIKQASYATDKQTKESGWRVSVNKSAARE